MDRPIICSAPMVLALLAGRKTQTRRLATRKVPFFKGSPAFRLMDTTWCDVQADDRLWVRENIWHASPYPGTFPSGEPDDTARWSSRLVHYAADGNPADTPNRHYPHGLRNGGFSAPDPYAMWILRPSIHMPRWASRITLTVTDVRRQRLRDISEDDAIAEGLASTTKDGKFVKYGAPDKDGLPGTDDHGWPWHDWRISPVDAFERLWRSIHGDGAWQANPEVVALTFSVALRNIDSQEAA